MGKTIQPGGGRCVLPSVGPRGTLLSLFNFKVCEPYLKDYYQELHKTQSHEEFLDWFRGFTEGDGSFILKKGKRKAGPIWIPIFEITLNIKDYHLLCYIQDRLGIGNVSILDRVKAGEIIYIARYSVTTKSGIAKLIEIFNGNFLAVKRHDQFTKSPDFPLTGTCTGPGGRCF